MVAYLVSSLTYTDNIGICVAVATLIFYSVLEHYKGSALVVSIAILTSAPVYVIQ